MKLSEKALQAISEKKIRLRLAMLLDKTEQTIVVYIKKNDPTLTQAQVLKFIEEETGLKQKQILVNGE